MPLLSLLFAVCYKEAGLYLGFLMCYFAQLQHCCCSQLQTDPVIQVIYEYSENKYKYMADKFYEYKYKYIKNVLECT